jgi:hypothetical protein
MMEYHQADPDDYVCCNSKRRRNEKEKAKRFKIATSSSSLLLQLLSITKQIIHAKEPIEDVHQNKPLSSSLLSIFRPLTRNLTSFPSIGYCSIFILSSPCKTR